MKATEYLGGLAFAPDPFQVEACEAIDRGASVVVSAPTGSGKTVVADAAIARALGRGLRAVYTTPIKALSNQKFVDLREEHGATRVGLLTGDNTINPTADVVVMTTEVLRNMMYASSRDLASVGVVILDEVHYLQDRQRGGVWEEIFIHLDRSIPLVCLSATIANAAEFAAWVEERRGDTHLVISEERPVPLEALYLMRDRWERGRLRLHPIFRGQRLDDRLARMVRGKGERRYAAPRRYETCDLLRREGLLPAIYFIFSRAGCDGAVDTVVSHGLALTTAEQRHRIGQIADERLAHLAEEDRQVLGVGRWREGLLAGVASHHAGLVPAMKETVEELFMAGLVRVVFATETLALGINMPARTAVIESLSKFTGESHELLSPGDFTQLTGRAGRRGIDTAGTAIVLHSAYVDVDQVSRIAGRGSHPLESSFRPTYNMAVNLIARYDQETAERLLNASFATFRDQRKAASARDTLASSEARLAELLSTAETGGPEAWEEARRSPKGSRPATAAFAGTLMAGDVIEGVVRSDTSRRHVVVARGWGSHPRLLTIDEQGRLHRLASTKLPETIRWVGKVTLPAPIRANDTLYRASVAEMLGGFTPGEEPPRGIESESGPDPAAVAAAREALRLEAKIARDRTSAQHFDKGLVRRFRAINALLEERGYLDGWSLTDKGQRLRKLYAETDLLLSEVLDEGVASAFDAPQTAAFVSALTFEARRDATGTAWHRSVASEGAALIDTWESLAGDEGRHSLPETREPDPGFSVLAYRWAAGETLADILPPEAPVGDFVRNCRQLIDLLRQLEDLSHPGAPAAGAAAGALDRGVVAAVGIL